MISSASLHFQKRINNENERFLGFVKMPIVNHKIICKWHESPYVLILSDEAQI